MHVERKAPGVWGQQGHPKQTHPTPGAAAFQCCVLIHFSTFSSVLRQVLQLGMYRDVLSGGEWARLPLWVRNGPYLLSFICEGVCGAHCSALSLTTSVCRLVLSRVHLAPLARAAEQHSGWDNTPRWVALPADVRPRPRDGL